MRRRILVVEDEDSIRAFVVINLQQQGYEVKQAVDGAQALMVFNNEELFDLVVLDVMMPEMDGFELARQIRVRNTRTGILFLTALSHETDKIKGLLLGADDYMTKPFSPTELVARVEAVLRRVAPHQPPSEAANLVSGAFVLDVPNRRLTHAERTIELTNIETQLMGLLMTHEGEILSRDVIFKAIWVGDQKGVENSKVVDVNMRRLRMKLEPQPSVPQYIQTVWGLGYKWVGA